MATEQELQEQIDKLHNEIRATGINFLDQTRELVGKQLKDLVEKYSMEIRNLTIISGTVAPFSLSLLSIEKLDVNIKSLLIGFIFLLLNMILAQFSIFSLSRKHDHKVNRAMVAQVLAELNLPDIGTDDVVDYLKYSDELQENLGLKKRLDLQLMETREQIKAYYCWVIFLFTIGTIFIILSVVTNPIIDWWEQSCF